MRGTVGTGGGARLRRGMLMAGLGAAVGLAGCSFAVGGEEEGGGTPADARAERRDGAGALDRSRPPEVGRPPSLRFPEVAEITLPNGMRVLLVERRDLPVVEIGIQFPGGAGSLDARTAGLATFVADMLDEGTARRSALEIAEAVDRLGASLYSGASWDASTVELSVLKPRLDEALDVLADIVVDPAFETGEVERVREERLTRILQNLDEPRALADQAFIRILYGAGHPYGSPLLGTRESVAALDRDDLVAFYRRHYRPENATVVVAGDVDEEEVREALAPHLARWEAVGPDSPRPEGPSRDAAGPPAAGRSVADRPAAGPTIHLVDRPDAPQSEIRLGRIGVDRATEDYFPLTVMNTVLGGSFTSRLNSILREERGYTYGAFSSFAMRRRPGPFVAQAAVNTPATDSAVAIFLRELERIREEAVPEEELRRARSYTALRLPQRFETVNDVADRLAELVLYELPLDFYETFVERTLAVTGEDVAAAARRHLDASDLVIVVAGDADRIEAPLRALGVGEVVRLPTPGADEDGGEP